VKKNLSKPGLKKYTESSAIEQQSEEETYLWAWAWACVLLQRGKK
jgi:hypothetical protein